MTRPENETGQDPKPSGPRKKNLAKKAIPLVGVAFGMLGMAYAAVPLYQLFCAVTGFGGTTQTAEGRSAPEPIDRTMTVRFNSALDRGMPWEFKPVTKTTTLRIGETGLAFYEAYNPTDRVIGGRAVYNVSPFSMGGYFVKIDCFCFNEQVLKPGERVMMPVTYYVDPEMVDDPETESVTTVTLSYTFYEEEVEDAPGEQAQLGENLGDAAAN